MLIAFLYKHYGIGNFISLGFCNAILGFFFIPEASKFEKGDRNIVYIGDDDNVMGHRPISYQDEFSRII